MSYLLYLLAVDERLARAYLEAALTACKLARVEPSFLLHPLDFVSGDVVGALAFFPGMALPTARKLAWLDAVLVRLARDFTLVDLETHAAEILARGAGSLRRLPADSTRRA